MGLEDYKSRIELLNTKSKNLLNDKEVDFHEIEAFVSFNDETRLDFLEETIGSKRLNKQFKKLPIMETELYGTVKNSFTHRLLGKFFKGYDPIRKAKKIIKNNRPLYSKILHTITKELDESF